MVTMGKLALVTGAAGFIASNVVDSLLEKGYEVIGLDRARKPRPCFDDYLQSMQYTYVQSDIARQDDIFHNMSGVDIVYHMAANSNIRVSGIDPTIDFDSTLKTTERVLEAMRRNEVGKIFFPSSSAVYGSRKGLLAEDSGNLSPISYYGACKLSSEALISAYSHMNGIDALIFRLANVIGPDMTHGVIYDLVKKLKEDPNRLQVLGNGAQRKQYAHIDDLKEGIIGFSERISQGVSTYNISTRSSIDVREIVSVILEKTGLDPEVEYTGGESGWNGDVPSYELDISKAVADGWNYRYDSKEAVEKTLDAFCKE